MSKIQEIVNQLRKFYPTLEILVWSKGNRGQLLVNTKVIFKFDPEFIETQLNKLGQEAFEETTKIWAEYVEKKYIQRINRFNKKPNGRPGLGFTESQIKMAIQNSKSNNGAARYLHVSYNTYAKYARLYGLFDQHKNKSGKGISKGGHLKKVPFSELFANTHPNYNQTHFKNRLISEMILEEKCAVCGYHERRSFDQKMALVLDYIDGNNKNMSKENIRLICLNCKFNIRGKMSERVLKQIDKEYNENIIKEETDKVNKVWNDLNPDSDVTKETPFESPIFQNTSENAVEDIWKKFNK